MQNRLSNVLLNPTNPTLPPFPFVFDLGDLGITNFKKVLPPSSHWQWLKPASQSPAVTLVFAMSASPVTVRYVHWKFSFDSTDRTMTHLKIPLLQCLNQHILAFRKHKEHWVSMSVKVLLCNFPPNISLERHQEFTPESIEFPLSKKQTKWPIELWTLKKEMETWERASHWSRKLATLTSFLLISRKIWLKSCGKPCNLFFYGGFWRELVVSLQSASTFVRRISARIASYTDQRQLSEIHSFLQRCHVPPINEPCMHALAIVMSWIFYGCFFWSHGYSQGKPRPG